MSHHKTSLRFGDRIRYITEGIQLPRVIPGDHRAWRDGTYVRRGDKSSWHWIADATTGQQVHVPTRRMRRRR